VYFPDGVFTAVRTKRVFVSTGWMPGSKKWREKWREREREEESE
jgi:hypothetical protein